MSQYRAMILWRRGEQSFVDNAYSRGHQWSFDGGLTVPASSSPDVVPLPMSVAENVDPEEAFVAAISSCHMLFFLAVAARRGIVVDQYEDNAIGIMQERADGRIAMAQVILRPHARYSGERIPDRQKVEKMHRRAHELCYIANSVRTEIITEIVA
jgi:organic hydroperoxide reductase OsmC/OhrA